MGLYYLHLRDGTDLNLEPEGVEFADLDSIRKAVHLGARDIIANDVKSDGLVDLRQRIDAEDEAGTVVYSPAFPRGGGDRHRGRAAGIC